jgi:hypothetical protein
VRDHPPSGSPPDSSRIACRLLAVLILATAPLVLAEDAHSIEALEAAPRVCAEIGRVPNGSALKPLLTSSVEPKEFGSQDDTRTVVSATSFEWAFDGGPYQWANAVSPVLGVYSANPQLDQHYYASLDVPSGAIIDAIGLNSASDTDGVLGVALWQKSRYDVSPVLLAGFSAPAHDWDTDFFTVSIQIPNHVDNSLFLDVEQAPNPNQQSFGWVEVWWHRTVSPPPSTATFADVPTTHPFFQFIEAIYAAGITAGCGGGNFCPDQAITRKQEAAFLSKALGLHWPN